MRGSHRRYGACEDRMLNQIEEKRAVVASLSQRPHNMRAKKQQLVASLLLQTGRKRAR